MKFLAMIQARCGSTRLPNKVLMNICNVPVLQHVIERVRRSKMLDDVIVLTTLKQEDLEIVKLTSQLGTRVYCGSESDVLDRFYQAAKILNPEYIIRITADCPLFDSELLDDAICELRDDADYLGDLDETFADGLDLEIVRFGALEKAWKEARLSSDREHVTLYIKNHKDKFVIQNYSSKMGNLHQHRWTLDQMEDFHLINRIYQHFDSMNQKDFSTPDILKVLEVHPEWLEINQSIVRNEGLLISLKKDECRQEHQQKGGIKELFLNTEGDAYFYRNQDKLEGYVSVGARILNEFIEKQGCFQSNKGNLLEIGCCSGYNLTYLCEKYPLLSGYGIEPSMAAVKHGTEMLTRNSNICVELVQGVSDQLPYDDEQFDIVLVGFCLFWVDRRFLQRTIAEIDRVLKSGGIILLEDFDTTKPYKRINKHHALAYTYKMNYTNLFLSNPQYHLVKKESYSHDSDKFNENLQERICSTILYKENEDHAYILDAAIGTK